jgi:hypothetical protein
LEVDRSAAALFRFDVADQQKPFSFNQLVSLHDVNLTRSLNGGGKNPSASEDSSDDPFIPELGG